jgi:hypothetical protein
MMLMACADPVLVSRAGEPLRPTRADAVAVAQEVPHFLKAAELGDGVNEVVVQRVGHFLRRLARTVLAGEAAAVLGQVDADVRVVLTRHEAG